MKRTRSGLVYGGDTPLERPQLKRETTSAYDYSKMDEKEDGHDEITMLETRTKAKSENLYNYLVSDELCRELGWDGKRDDYFRKMVSSMTNVFELLNTYLRSNLLSEIQEEVWKRWTSYSDEEWGQVADRIMLSTNCGKSVNDIIMDSNLDHEEICCLLDAIFRQYAPMRLEYDLRGIVIK